MVRNYLDKCNAENNLIRVNEFYVYSCGAITSDVNFEKPKEVPKNSRDRKESVGQKGAKKNLLEYSEAWKDTRAARKW